MGFKVLFLMFKALNRAGHTLLLEFWSLGIFHLALGDLREKVNRCQGWEESPASAPSFAAQICEMPSLKRKSHYGLGLLKEPQRPHLSLEMLGRCLWLLLTLSLLEAKGWSRKSSAQLSLHIRTAECGLCGSSSSHTGDIGCFLNQEIHLIGRKWLLQWSYFHTYSGPFMPSQ